MSGPDPQRGPPAKSKAGSPSAPAPRAAATPPPPAAADEAAPPPAAPKRRPFQGWGTALGKVLYLAGNALAAVSARLYSEARRQGSAAVDDFQGRAEHVRYRAYALGSYGGVVALTLLAQLYTDNAINAYVRITRIEIPETVEVFVRNDSAHGWRNVKLTLNGAWTYERAQLATGQNILIKVDSFAVFDKAGKAKRAPRDLRPQKLAIDTDEGHFEKELDR